MDKIAEYIKSAKASQYDGMTWILRSAVCSNEYKCGLVCFEETCAIFMRLHCEECSENEMFDIIPPNKTFLQRHYVYKITSCSDEPYEAKNRYCMMRDRFTSRAYIDMHIGKRCTTCNTAHVKELGDYSVIFMLAKEMIGADIATEIMRAMVNYP